MAVPNRSSPYDNNGCGNILVQPNRRARLLTYTGDGAQALTLVIHTVPIGDITARPVAVGLVAIVNWQTKTGMGTIQLDCASGTVCNINAQHVEVDIQHPSGLLPAIQVYGWIMPGNGSRHDSVFSQRFDLNAGVTSALSTIPAYAKHANVFASPAANAFIVVRLQDGAAVSEQVFDATERDIQIGNGMSHYLVTNGDVVNHTIHVDFTLQL